MHKMRSFRSAFWLFLAVLMSLTPAVSHAQVAVSITVAPPALPVYVQPSSSRRGLYMDARLLGLER